MLSSVGTQRRRERVSVDNPMPRARRRCTGAFNRNMNGTLAQVVALTCHGNAIISGMEVTGSFATNSSCQFYDTIRFVKISKSWIGRTREVEVAKSPDEWMASLGMRGAIGIRLVRQTCLLLGISDRMSAGLVGGGGTWMLEVMREDRMSEFWAVRWEVWKQDAPDWRIWKVKRGMLREARTRPYPGRKIADVKADLQKSLDPCIFRPAKLRRIYQLLCR